MPTQSHASPGLRKAHADASHDARQFLKLAGHRVCTECHVTCFAGRWSWEAAVPHAAPTLCPACRRVRDRHAAHVLRLEGLHGKHRDEVLAMVFHIAELERAEHPLERLMLVRKNGNHNVEIATTGVHIARRLLANLLRVGRRRVQVIGQDEMTTVRWQG